MSDPKSPSMQPLRPLVDQLAEQDARRASSGPSGSTLEAMMAALSAQVTKDAQARKAGEGEAEAE